MHRSYISQPKKAYLTIDGRRRRMMFRRVFVKQRLEKFKHIVSRYEGKIRVPLDWRKYMSSPAIQETIQDARDILYYSNNTEDYWIWLVLLRCYRTSFKHE